MYKYIIEEEPWGYFAIFCINEKSGAKIKCGRENTKKKALKYAKKCQKETEPFNRIIAKMQALKKSEAYMDAANPVNPRHAKTLNSPYPDEDPDFADDGEYWHC